MKYKALTAIMAGAMALGAMGCGEECNEVPEGHVGVTSSGFVYEEGECAYSSDTEFHPRKSSIESKFSAVSSEQFLNRLKLDVGYEIVDPDKAFRLFRRPDEFVDFIYEQHARHKFLKITQEKTMAPESREEASRAAIDSANGILGHIGLRIKSADETGFEPSWHYLRLLQLKLEASEKLKRAKAELLKKTAVAEDLGGSADQHQ